jgi:hypothetical protein
MYKALPTRIRSKKQEAAAAATTATTATDTTRVNMNNRPSSDRDEDEARRAAPAAASSHESGGGQQKEMTVIEESKPSWRYVLVSCRVVLLLRFARESGAVLLSRPAGEARTGRGAAEGSFSRLLPLLRRSVSWSLFG